MTEGVPKEMGRNTKGVPKKYRRNYEGVGHSDA
jgi:hypothetical protein